MMAALFMTWRYLTHHKVKWVLLSLCFGIALFLPMALSLLVRNYERDLSERAAATPLLLGSRGDRYDLVLKSLYFEGSLDSHLSAHDLDLLREKERGLAIPLIMGFTAREYPVIGTSYEYFEFRGLRPAEGKLPSVLGDAVLGADVAETLGVKPGESLFTDQTNLIDISAAYPLKMRVSGVLAKTFSPDDNAIFVDIKTLWIIAGIGHGHTDLTKPEASSLLMNDDEGKTVGGAAVVEYNEITPENIDSFHFHAERELLPLSAIIITPASPKDAVILSGNYHASKTLQLLKPKEVIDELLGVVFRVKRLFDLQFILVSLLCILFTVLVILLSLRLRKREQDVMFRIGCSRWMVFKLQFAEILLAILAGAVLAFCVITVLMKWAPDWIRTYL